MQNKLDFAVVGNDARLFFCTETLKKRGYAAAQFSGGVPPTAKYYLFAPPLNASRLENIAILRKGVEVFAGAVSKDAHEIIKVSGASLTDYAADERFAYANAELTAEAAMLIYSGASAKSFLGADVLVCGFGRIGKALAHRLRAFGADVTVSARKINDIELIRAYGCKPMETAGIRGEYDVIFNTVPAHVFTRDILDRTKTEYYVELASAPFGMADTNAWSVGTKVIKAGGLPGKVFPVTAGRLIAETVCTILEERRI